MGAPLDADLVRCLLREQQPQWADLPVRAVQPGGWDNRTFRLGEGLLVRLPSAAGYASAVAKEQRWLPLLAGGLPLAVPKPVAHGRPGCGFAWPWSVYRWLPGEAARPDRIGDGRAVARTLAAFLRALHAVDTTNGPSAGDHSFGRGGPLGRYDAETRSLATRLLAPAEAECALALWDAALGAPYDGPAMWVHGDLTGSNLLTEKGRLTAVIDWGTCATGDPACDLAVAWTLLEPPARAVFVSELALDAAMWRRARCWVLWKALVTLADPASATTAPRRFGWRLPARQLVPEVLQP